MSYNMLSELAVGNHHYVVKVRITRIWDSTTPFVDNNRVMSVDFLAADEQGTCIQGTIRTEDSIHIKSMLDEGHVYEIGNFNVIPARRSFRAVSNDRFIHLTKTSKINELTGPIDDIPTYIFNCCEFSELPQRAYNDDCLTDVIGVLVKIGRIGTAYIQEKPTVKRNIIIQNESGQVLNVTIWGNHANELNHNEMLDKPSPVVVILSGMTVRQFHGEVYMNSTSAFRCYTNLPIPQVENFIDRLSPGDYKVQLLPEEQEPVPPDEAKKQNRKTIRELLNLHSSHSQHLRFTCEATVKEIICNQGWWYAACPKCFYGVKTEDGQVSCNNHGPINELPIPWYKMEIVVEDTTATTNFMVFGRIAQQLVHLPASILATRPDSDRYVLPNELKDLIGRTYIFQIAPNLRKGRTNYANFKVTKFFGLQEDKAGKQALKEHSLQSNSPAKDQSSSGVDHSSNSTPVPSQIQRELFASEESQLSISPGFRNVPAIEKQDATSSKKRGAQRELLADHPSKKAS